MIKNSMLLAFSLISLTCGYQKKVSAPQTTALPNIVFILADDMGYGDAGCYNSESLIPTPNIDKLASEGILFTDAHSAAALCTPSRYGLLTGRYCWRTRLKRGVLLGYDETPLIEKGRYTLGSLLQQSGYQTACIGKWHLGLNWPTTNGYILQDDKDQWQEPNSILSENEKHVDFSKPVWGGPQDLGFDYSFITLGCSTGDPPYVFIKNNYPVAIPDRMSPPQYAHLPGFVPGLMADDWSEELVDTIFTHQGIEFIDRHVKEQPDRPFFLYLALSSPHIPFLAPDFTKGKSKEGPRGDLVYLADWCVGRIQETIDKYHLANNTLFIFSSDNGPERGANGHLSAGKFKGHKAQIWEGGHRVPFIAKWPAKIKPGLRSDAVFSMADMFATFANLTGKTNTPGGEDSHNVLARLTGQIVDKDDENARIFSSGLDLYSVRQGQWKYIEGKEDKSKKLQVNYAGPNEGMMYNMATDPYETRDVSNENRHKEKKLQGLLDNIRSN